MRTWLSEKLFFFIAGRHLHLLLTMQLLWKSHILFYLDNNTALSFFCCLPPRPPFSLIHAFMSVAISLFNFIHVSTDVHDSWYSFVIWSSIIQYAFIKKKQLYHVGVIWNVYTWEPCVESGRMERVFRAEREREREIKGVRMRIFYDKLQVAI